jgi:hypothetical protein
VKARFAVPRGGASIEPRVTGWRAQTVSVRGLVAVRQRNILLADEKSATSPPLENRVLKVDLDGATGGIAVTDKRTGRVWKPLPQEAGWLIQTVSEEVRHMTTLSGGRTETQSWPSKKVNLINPQDMREFSMTLEVEAKPDASNPELLITLSGEGEMHRPLNFPAPFATRPGDRLIVPANEGLGYPVDEEHTGLWRMYTYGGHGLCMAFFGVAEDATGAGWMCILETPDDGAMDARKGANGLWQAGLSWDAQRGAFGYERKARFVFFESGGHVAM